MFQMLVKCIFEENVPSNGSTNILVLLLVDSQIASTATGGLLVVLRELLYSKLR